MRYEKLSPLARKAPAILLLMLTLICSTGALSTCGGPGRSARVLPRELPPKPVWAVPVGVSRPPAGTDWIEVAKREQNARKAANSRLVRFGQWYDERRVEYGKGTK